jgi:dCMP deaminase
MLKLNNDILNSIFICYIQMKPIAQIQELISSWDKRLNWKSYFMSIAQLSASRSPCHRLQVGCVIVKDNRIISTGYNGFLPDAPHTSIVINEHEQATVHAEQNCIADCAKRGVSVINGTAYITHFPCVNCFKILAAAGIKNIIYMNDYNNDEVVYQLSTQIGIDIHKTSMLE